MMRKAETILAIIRKYGQRKQPIEGVYRLLYQVDLYLNAYGKIYRNKGAMTRGITNETVDEMSLNKIGQIINALRQEKYRWLPAKRIYIKKSNGKQRPLGLPVWSNKLLQEVIRQILEAYYEPQFSVHSHGFRPNRGCHTALREVAQKGRGTKWFIEGDIQGCFNEIDHTILLNNLRKSFHDNRFIRLISGLLKAGYLEDWKYHLTHSGAAQGSLTGPILSNVMLDNLDKYVETELIPAYTRGQRRKTNPPYVSLTWDAHEARKVGDWEKALMLSKQAKQIPSRDPNDPNFRRLWYVRYADDFLLGFSGPKKDALDIKNSIHDYLRDHLKLKLSEDKTLITHAQTEKAKFLSYEVQTLHENSKHDHRGQRCINGGIGFTIPIKVRNEKCARYMRNGKPKSLPQRTIDDAYSIVSEYQTEYRGIVQYYKMAYNLHTLSKLKHVMEVSLVKTLANKYKTTCAKIYRRYGTTIEIPEGKYKVLMVRVNRELPKCPLLTHFGGIPLKWNRWVSLGESNAEPIWSKRSELVERLLAQQCELCRATKNIEVHHIRKLKDLETNKADCPEWKKRMSARKRKTLVLCQNCHANIHYGRYDGKKLANHT